MFLRQRGSSLEVDFESEDFILSLAYLSDIFTRLNDLNISIQGKKINMITGREKISPFTSKLLIWKNRIDCENYANFPKLDEVSTSTASLPEHIVIQIKEHLQVLRQSFEGCFYHGDVSDLHGWIQDPFLFNLGLMDENDQTKDDLVEMRASKIIKMKFDLMHLATFSCAQLEMFPQLAKSALKILVPLQQLL